MHSILYKICILHWIEPYYHPNWSDLGSLVRKCITTLCENFNLKFSYLKIGKFDEFLYINLRIASIHVVS